MHHILNWLWFGFLVTWYWQVLWVGAAKNNCIVVDHFDWTFCACLLQVGRYRLRSAIGNTASPSTTANRRIQVCSPARRPTDSQTASQSMLWVSVSLFAVLYWSPPPIIATQTFLSLSPSLRARFGIERETLALPSLWRFRFVQRDADLKYCRWR